MLNSQFTILFGMAVGLGLFYRGGALPIVGVGLAIFGLLALWRPYLALLFVPITMPWYLIPTSIPGIRPDGEFLLPLHEVALLMTVGACGARWLGRRASGIRGRGSGVGGQGLGVRGRETRRHGDAETRKPGDQGQRTTDDRQPTTDYGLRTTLHALLLPAVFLGVGAVTVLIAVERGPALREFRWTIVEPLLFYALLRVPQLDPDDSSLAERLIPILGAFVLSGAIVGVFGLLQFVGIDIVEALLGTKRDFAENIVPSAGLRRVASVFGHPNNLGLYLERVWPIAVVVALIVWKTQNPEPRTQNPEQPNNRTTEQKSLPAARFPLPASLVLASFLCLGGLFVSFSRGAWLGSAFALLVLALPFVYGRLGRRAILGVVGLGAVVAMLAGVALLLRGDPTSGSTWPRLMIWQESLALIARYPLGLGLDQFYYYHNPEFGRSLINPALIGTSEQYVSHPHNFVLDIWLRMGPFGLAVFVWLLVRFFRKALEQGSGVRGQTGRQGDRETGKQGNQSACVAVVRDAQRQGDRETGKQGNRETGSGGNSRSSFVVRRSSVVGSAVVDTQAGLLRLGALAAMVAALIHGLVDNFYFLPELAISFWLLLAVVESQEGRD
jgi:hypothetical protein